ncbi:MAG: AmmeMemoRadiSam system protein A [Desulfobulbaceae bacterium]|nr:AmmeMemoRadiSam system protein A [Desulfobulbaceae bacterium]HIJ78750.1 AmmeMemoRadiSam system protein A [Deltaproteobacteria bacterium]
MADSENKNGELTQELGRELLALARHVITERVGGKGLLTPEQITSLSSEQALQQKRGTFVTLKKNGQLRGCIGSLADFEAIFDGVRRNAENAAFHDHRFSPVQLDEMAEIIVEISILTNPQVLAYEDAADLIAKLRPGIDGVIIRKGQLGATFLPQVWEQVPRPEDFLGHLCLKAMLSSDAWRLGELEVSVYQVQYFEEE